MGAWGHNFDENDDAADWLAEFEEAPSWERVQQTLQDVKSASEEYLEAPECSMGLAAAEVVAAGLGKPSQRLPEELVDWASENSSGATGFKLLAHEAVSVVRSDSELLELWQESDEADAWLVTVDDLLNRLN